MRGRYRGRWREWVHYAAWVKDESEEIDMYANLLVNVRHPGRCCFTSFTLAMPRARRVAYIDVYHYAPTTDRSPTITHTSVL